MNYKFMGFWKWEYSGSYASRRTCNCLAELRGETSHCLACDRLLHMAYCEMADWSKPIWCRAVPDGSLMLLCSDC